MAKKKRGLTFAERATLIMNKYKKFEGDPIAEKTMELELSDLAREQEAKKQEMGIGQDTQEMGYGGKKKMFDGGETDFFTHRNKEKTDFKNNMFDIDNPIPTFNPESPKSSESITAPNSPFSPEDFLGSSEAPKVGYQGMAASAGNLYSLIDGLSRGPIEEQYSKVDAQHVDGTQRKRDARETINTGVNNVNASIREGSLSSGARIGATISNEGRRRKEIGNALNLIQEQVDNVNVGIDNQTAQLNNQIENMQRQANYQNQAAFRDRIAGDVNTIGGAFASRSAEQRKAEATNTMNARIMWAIRTGVLEDFLMSDDFKITPNTENNVG